MFGACVAKYSIFDWYRSHSIYIEMCHMMRPNTFPGLLPSLFSSYIRKGSNLKNVWYSWYIPYVHICM